jgi:hypothetical protein
VLGDLTLVRAYYHCAACDAQACPCDATPGLDGTSLSPAVTRMVGFVAAMVGFAQGHGLLHELAGVDVPTTHVERPTDALGREIAADEHRMVAPKASVSRPASSKPGARWPSAPGSRAPGCIGPSQVPTRSSRCGAASSADASRTSGNDDQRGPTEKPREPTAQI